MKIYYVGFIIENDSNDLSKIKVITTLPINETPFFATEGVNNGLPNLRYSHFGEITDETILKYLNDTEFYATNKFPKIIYEQIEDENGNIYAKELLTGLLFPFTGDDNSTINYSNDGKEIKRIWTHSDDNMAKTKYTVVMNQVASKNMINEYKRKILLRGKIVKLYDENVFKKQIIEKRKKILETQNEHTKLMEDIELLLELLKKQNKKVYLKLKDEYKKIKNGKEDTLVAIEPTIEDFKRLISKIKLYSGVGEDLTNYLSNIIEDYYVKMVTNTISDEDLSVNDLDNIMEMFLISKDDYDIRIQRGILKEISMLYLFVVKSNIENININKLNNSYFKDNLKTILLNILVLNDMEIIKNAPGVNFDDNITVESIFNMIKEIEFDKTNKEKVKNLIK
jgi:hypothetical protein